jgi:glycosyltransferase involved in cell wall biosynthesis
MQKFFSILIPTKNRSYLLDQALQILFASSFRNFEVIVSDDSDDESLSMAVCSKYKEANIDVEIEYVRPEKRISMIDNFNHALSFASGKYVMVLYDDDAIMPSSLEYLYDVLSHYDIDVLVTQMSLYHHTDLKESSIAGSFSHISHTGNLYRVKTQAYIDLIAEFDVYDHALVMPKSGNCAIKKTLFEECQRLTNASFFTSPFPDYPTACHIAGVREHVHIIDLPLYIGGTSAPSNSAIFYDRKNKWDNYLRLIGEDMLLNSPCPLRYITYPYIEFMLRKFEKLYPHSFSVTINYNNFFKRIYNEFTVIQSYGENIDEEVAVLKQSMRNMFGSDDEFLKLENATSQLQNVSFSSSGLLSNIKKIMRWLIQNSNIAFDFISRLSDFINKGKRHIYRHFYFSTIVEAATFFDPFLRSYCIKANNLSPKSIDTAHELRNIIHH